MFKSILIANRGEIACRIIRTARRMGVRTIAVYSDVDRGALHTEMADAAYHIGPPPAASSYANADAIIKTALQSGAEAIHPGYGFLSENAEFAAAVEETGLTFIGPPANAIRAMGLKDAGKDLMRGISVPVLPGYHGPGRDCDDLAREARRIGHPILIKARAGGAGRGIRLARDEEDFPTALASACQEAELVFGDGACLLEKYLPHARHIEVQIVADSHGNVVHLFERDCSVQRRYQKVIEEAPAPGLTEEEREYLGRIAVKAARAVGYRGAGTVEFIADIAKGFSVERCYFMEMNTRLQVEHPVTEAITGIDLVEWQLRVAAGEKLPLRQDQITRNGTAIEARIFTEGPGNGNRLTRLQLANTDARVDAGMRTGDVITKHYDPLIAKLIVHAPDRETAITKLRCHLRDSAILGVATNLPMLQALANSDAFSNGELHTALAEVEYGIERHDQPQPSPGVTALAALTALGLASPPQQNDPFMSLRGWRHWCPAMYVCSLDHNRNRLSVTLEQRSATSFLAAVNGEPLALQLITLTADDVVLYEASGQSKSANVTQDGAVISIHQDGQTFQFAVSEEPLLPAEAGPSQQSQPNIITAPIQGTVRAIHTERGARVKQGDAIAVMEAMKMEFTVSAPRDGIVAAVHTTPGQSVEPGACLITLEPEAALLAVHIPDPRIQSR